ncbi:replication-relaxation family protein [Candidatus Uhrbacteria bacterium]|nr:replication-relaxation family protein [Candidatus Uhrbacteria bacterium]
MPAEASRRTARRDPGGARRTVRDTLVLTLVERAQPVTIDQVARGVQMSVPMARRRLRVLRDLGLVTVHLPEGLNGPNRVTLAPAARPVLAAALGGEAGDYRVRDGVERVNLAHHDGQVDLYVALSVACGRSRAWRLARFLFEGELRRALPNARLVPDAVALLSAGAGQVAVAFEVDLGTESPSWLAHKALAYAALRSAGAPLLGTSNWRVAVTVPTARRRNRLALAAWEAGLPEGLVSFAVASELTDRDILAPTAWLTPRVVTQDGTERARLAPSCLVETVPTDRSHGGNGLVGPGSRAGADPGSVQEGSFRAGERP